MFFLRNILLVGCGGFAGAVLRYLAALWVQQWAQGTRFPVGTLAVNVTGCLVIGLLGGWADHIGAFRAETRLVVFIGGLGGFTTFSSFGYETMALLRDGMAVAALANAGLQLSLGMLAVWAGYTAASLL